MEAELPQHETESLQITPELLRSKETGIGITAGCSALGVCTGSWAGLAPGQGDTAVLREVTALQGCSSLPGQRRSSKGAEKMAQGGF